MNHTLEKTKKLLNIYFTAGYPTIDSFHTILAELEKQEVDIIEIGMPYSDPLADGKTIQETSTTALKNGMNLPLLFQLLKEVPTNFKPNIYLMGYFNQVLQYGVEAFCKACQTSGVKGVILPDLPPEIYERNYRETFESNQLSISFLITPQTPTSRIQYLDRLTSGFLYVVSSGSTTGKKEQFNTAQLDYFKRIESFPTRNQKLIGFGIHNRQTLQQVNQYADGAIIGSAFLNAIKNSENIEQNIQSFFQSLTS